MSRSAEEVNKLTESTYKNVMDQFNPGLRNLVNLGKNYEKSVAAMTLAGRLYFDAMSKIGESAVVSPVSRDLGVVLMGISEVHRKVFFEWEDNFKRFHREIITELERKTDMDVKYMTATFKRYQMEHKMKQDSLEKSQADLKKLRRKSQGKNANKYENKESECLETLTNRQMDMQLFIADGCKEALLEEKRRFCFLVDKHCMFSYQIASFHDKARDILTAKLSSWQDQCNDATDMPESVVTMIEGLRTPVSITPLPSPTPSRHSLNISAPPAPSQKAHVSPLVSMFTPDNKTPSGTRTSNNNTDHDSNGENNLARSVSVATGLNHVVKRPRVRTIFPHAAGNNNTLLSFDEGDVIILLIPEEKDGWMYGEMEKNGKRGWFPSSYCRAFSEPLVNNNSVSAAPYRSRSVVNLHHQDTETDEATMILPPEDYADNRAAAKTSASTFATANHHRRHSPTPSAVSTSSSEYHTTNQPNGISRPTPAYLAGGNPFSTVRLRPTVTNDRSAPVI
ncbi:brain-specific angiogenesis inhibitor 1-associated protein 2-like protein 1b isoform X1 [Corythoichthys intestinalis]|uniref:brain-specific angiogenesis inhibitor 1-associated protein 2-like protein 1b isoform X1 n=1 Tax=Corythoichthys intestinalis TaxID=161448 RepID=UPI0025A6570C|nr:brain-specific angiogenesis inhibitor 1-associated protein 2-like protein 1b isoform X1 [Corythoichthys intestinalis]XP_061805844.1 brain-specific angiogenesis inhibitor 1-associated protein 2-like protein 1 [Nerophis lumbriciformis]